MDVHAENGPVPPRSLFLPLFLPRSVSCVSYFDTNVFHEVGHRNSRGGNAEKLLRRAVRDGRITIAASLVTLGEIIDGLGSPNPDKRRRAHRQLLIAWRLSDWSRTIHQTGTLLTQDILAYFERGSPSPFLAGADLHYFLNGLRGVMHDATTKTPEQLANDLSAIIAEDERQKCSFSDGMSQRRGQAANECLQRGWRYPTFEEIWEAGSVGMLQGFVRRAGIALFGDLSADEAEGLLRRRVVRVSVAISLALWYAREFPVRGPTKQFEPSDSRDLHHVLSAAAAGADLFVCQERRLPRVMDLIQIQLAPMRVTTLDGLIAWISAPLGSSHTVQATLGS